MDDTEQILHFRGINSEKFQTKERYHAEGHHKYAQSGINLMFSHHTLSSPASPSLQGFSS